jgi:hypothetical protein
MAVTPGQIPVTPGSGKTLDTAELTVNSTTVEREVVVVASPSTPGNYAEVNANSALQVAVVGGVTAQDFSDAGNSSTTPLAANAVFTGIWKNVAGFVSLAVAVDTDQVSASTATAGLVINWSEDGVNVGDADITYVNLQDLTTSTLGGQTYVFPIKRQYYQLVYTNGATAQTVFRLQTMIKVNPVVGTLVDLDDQITGNMHGNIARSLLFGRQGYNSNTFQDATIKAPLTPPVVGDPALVVSISPTCPTIPRDMFGDMIATPRWDQFEINFSRGLDPTLINPTLAGTGSYSIGNGGATLSTGASAGSSCNFTSTVTLQYMVAHEWFGYLTGLFPLGVAGSHSREGFWNPTDGFWVGYEGTTWGLSVMQGGVVTQTAQSAMNGDPLNGTATSQFTSGGIPVAWNPQKINLYRLRGGWLGTGVVVLEIANPDGGWVVMHTFRNPNSLTTSYAYSTNWYFQAEVLNSTNATNLSLYMGGATFGAADCTWRPTDPFNNQTQLTGTTRSAAFAQQPANGAGQAAVFLPALMDQLQNLFVSNKTQQNDPLLEVQRRILLELKGIRLAMVQLACEGGKARESDFDPANFFSTGDEATN